MPLRILPTSRNDLTPNKAMKRTLDRDLFSLPLQSAALKRRLSRR
jgi:hypothetical protein